MTVSSSENQFFVYILRCADGTFYTGQTKDIEKRLELHASGKGAKYVRGRLPFDLKYVQTFPTRSEAMQREIIIKKFSRLRKKKLIKAEFNEIENTDTSFVGKLWNETDAS